MSDTTELLGSAPEDAPVGISAPSAAAGGSGQGEPEASGEKASASKSRSRGGTGLSSLLMPELQRIAQTMGIPGAGRMRKGQLVEAIEARQGGAPRQEAGAHQGSNQRVASAGADSTRLRKQDAMEPDTRTQPGIGDAAASGLGASARDGIGADVGGQQLSFDQAAPTDRPNGQTQQAPAQPATAQQSPAHEAPAQQAPAQQAGAQEAGGPPQGAREDAQPGLRDDAQPGLRDEAGPGETQRGD
ncbi:MAG: Rho termination factor N-terminal domain-containing protein, partial [Streptosporangiaceae bacterium]